MASVLPVTTVRFNILLCGILLFIGRTRSIDDAKLNSALIDYSSNAYTISCHVCHYNASHKEIFAPGERYNHKSMNKHMKKNPKCPKNGTVLHECRVGVSACVTTVSSESYRPTRESHEQTAVGYVISHYCGSLRDDETGCKYREGRTQGPSVTCICTGTGCNTGYNKANRSLQSASLPTLITLVTAIFYIRV